MTKLPELMVGDVVEYLSGVLGKTKRSVRIIEPSAVDYDLECCTVEQFRKFVEDSFYTTTVHSITRAGVVIWERER